MAVNVTGGALEFDAVIHASQFGAQIKRMELQLQGLTQTAQQQSQEMEGFAKKASVAIGSYFSVIGASNFLNDIIAVRGEFQKLEAVLTNSFGNNDQAKDALNMLTEYAAKTPFQLQEVSAAFVKLVNQGFTPTKEEMVSLGDLAASTGKDFGMLTEAIIDAQTGEMERLKEFGIRAEKDGDKVTFAFKEQKTTVDFTAEAIRNYILELGNMQGVAGATAAISATLEGQVSNLQDAYSRMLNSIGQDTQGIFSSAIQGVTYLIDNYQEVLDILKVLIITYGSYKAAIIATNVVNVIAADVTNGVTVAQSLQTRAMLIGKRAMDALNTTMLKNPAVLVASGIAALVSALVIFGKETNSAASKAELLDNAMEGVASKMAEAEAKIRPYIEALKNANISEQEKLRLYNELLVMDPRLVAGTDAKTLSLAKLTENVNLYLAALRKQYTLEANREAIEASIKEENAIRQRISELEKKRLRAENNALTAKDSEARGLQQFTAISTKTDIKVLETQLNKQQQVTTELSKSVVAGEKEIQQEKRRTEEVIEAEITALKKSRKETAATKTEREKFDRKIIALQKELEALTGKNAAKSQVKADKALDKRKEDIERLLEMIADAERSAVRSGLSKEESELDKINERYDELKKRAEELEAGGKVLERIAKARENEVSIFNDESAASKYKQQLDEQKELFDKFEDYQKQVGIETAEDLLAIKRNGFTSFLEYAKAEQDRLKNDNSNAAVLKKQFLGQYITTEEKRKKESEISEEVEGIQRVVRATLTAAAKRKQIESQYEKDLEILRKRYKGEDLTKREQILKESKQAELEEVDKSVILQSGLYKKLNQDILGFSKDRIKKEIEELKKILKKGTFTDAEGNDQVISPQMKKDIQSGIKQLEDFSTSTNEVFGATSDQLSEMASKAHAVANVFGTMADALAPVSSHLSEIFSQLKDGADLAGTALSGASAYASGDYVAAAQAGADMIGKIVGTISKSLNSAKEAQKTIDDFNRVIKAGELDINLAYRERLRLQVTLNKTRLDGLIAERKLIEEQKKLNEAEFDSILKKIQGEQFISGMETEKKLGSASLGLVGMLALKNTESKEVLSSLAGKSFEDLEKLFTSGQLTENAKQLFEQLQKLKQEGADIDARLEELKREAQELFTGTSSNAILDSIVDGFKNGMDSAADFASNFEDLMKQAMLNSLKFKYLEGPFKDFFAEFATAAESDGQLSSSEIDALRSMYNNIITNASQQFEQLQQISGLNIGGTGAGANVNSLSGAIKGMTEQQAELLAGQFGGLRLTAAESLAYSKLQLDAMQKIDMNTAAAVLRMDSMLDYWKAVTTGVKKLHIN